MKKLYAGILIFLLMIVALGLWEMIDASVAYRDRPMVMERAKPIESMSASPANNMEGNYA